MRPAWVKQDVNCSGIMCQAILFSLCSSSLPASHTWYYHSTPRYTMQWAQGSHRRPEVWTREQKFSEWYTNDMEIFFLNHEKKEANNVLFLSCFHMGELPQGNKGMIEWSQCKKDVCSPFLNFNSRKILAFLSMVL